jgi:hypothetical protein
LLKQQVAQNVAINLGYFDFPKKSQKASESSQISKELWNLVTLAWSRKHFFSTLSDLMMYWRRYFFRIF